MALPIEGYSVVAQFDRIRHLLDDGSLPIPNATALTDQHIWRCSFMAQNDALTLLSSLEKLGLNVSQGPDSDAVLINEFNRSVEPYCEWLQTGLWEKAVIAWLAGTTPETITAREGWDPKVGSGLVFHDPSSMQHLQFLRLDGNVEVFLNTKTGQEVYLGRTSTPVDSLFTTAAGVVRQHFINPGQPPLSGAPAQAVADAAAMLEQVLAEDPDWWNAQWFYGKSQLALGHHPAAYQAFHHAYRFEKNNEAVLRELAGVCLELRKFDEAVTIAEAAIALEPKNPELLGNLAVAYLLAARPDAARKAIDAATRLNPDDKINQTVSRVLAEIETGRRPQPASLHDLTKPAPAKTSLPTKRNPFRFPWKK